MPELPEVEVTRRSFERQIAGATVEGVFMGKPLRWPLGCSPQDLVGAQVRSVGRRGKYLLLNLDRGVLLVHLGMSGSLQFAQVLKPAGAHDHFELRTSQGQLRLNDPRRFGAVIHVPSLEDARARKLLEGLGVEPLEGDFAFEPFFQALKQRRSPVKQVLLAGAVVVGVGNIYASEALFRAGIRPTKPACTLGRIRADRLHRAIIGVLEQALELGGSTLRDFSSADGKRGYFQLDAMVYGRQGQPCRICETPITLLRQGQRSTFFCPHCQRA